MATIDLSRFDVQANPLAVDKQVFNNEGAASYKALAGVGKEVNQIATDMYAKHMDVFTDRESLAGTAKYKLSVADKQKELMLNVDEETDLIKGTDQTYEEALAEFAISERTRIGESLTEPQSRNKFGFTITPILTQDLADSTFKSAEITTKNTLARSTKKYSEASDALIASDSLSVQRNLNTAIADTDKYVAMVTKTSGLTVAQKVRKDGVTSLVKTGIEASLRNIGTGDDNASADFNSILGVGTMFQTKNGYKKYIMQNILDTNLTEKQMEERAEMIASEAFNNVNTNLSLVGHPEINLLSPEEKNSYLNRALAIKFKLKEANEDQNALKMTDWKAKPAREKTTPAQIPAWIAEGVRIMTSPSYKGDNVTKVRDTYEAAEKQMLQDYVTNELTKGRNGFDDFLATANARREMYAKAILVGQGVMSEKDYADVLEANPSVGDAYSLGVEKTLRAKQMEIQLKMARDPLYYYQSIPGNNETSAQAIKVINGKIVIDNVNLALAQKNMEDMMTKVGTTASALETANILPSGQLSDIANILQMSSPADQIKVYKKLNESPKLAMRIYSQMVAQNKMTPEQANLAANLGMGDSKTADSMNSNLIAIKNKYTKDKRVELIEGLKTEGFMGKDKDYKDIKEMTEKSISASRYMNGLKEVARASGMTEAEINNIYQNDAIQVLVLDKLAKTLQEDTSTFDQLTGGLGRKVDRATEEVIKEYYGSRIKPINSANLNVVTLPEGVDEARVSSRATKLVDKLKEDLKTGRLQVDFSDYGGMQKAKKYDSMSQEMKQKFWLRDAMDDISLNGTDVTGKSQELVAMFKDTNGQYYRLKLKKPDGKSYVPVIKNVRELQNSDENALHSKYFSQGMHTPQLREPSARVLPPAPRKDVTPKNIADDVMGNVSGKTQAKADRIKSVMDFIKREEGSEDSPRDDGYGNLTVGHGHVVKEGEKFGTVLDQDQKDELLLSDIASHQGGHMRKLKRELNVNQDAALTSLAINMGPNASSVRRIVDLVNAGKMKEAAKEFLKYGSVKNKKTGKTTEDLLERRKREKKLFETPVM